ncbi:MAG: hypothetical protein ACRD0F_06610, partial [Acidimicrobiales bacterium]
PTAEPGPARAAGPAGDGEVEAALSAAIVDGGRPPTAAGALRAVVVLLVALNAAVVHRCHRWFLRARS